MDNFAERFDTLDQTPVPDLWGEIQRRADASYPLAVSGSVVGLGRSGSRPLPSLLRMALIAGALIASLVIGAFIGGQLLKRPHEPIQTSPVSSPTPEVQSVELTCTPAADFEPGDRVTTVSADGIRLERCERLGLLGRAEGLLPGGLSRGKVNTIRVGNRVQVAWVNSCEESSRLRAVSTGNQLSLVVTERVAETCGGGSSLAVVELTFGSPPPDSIVGSINEVVVPDPSPNAGLDCAAMQQSATHVATGWPTGAPPESTPQNGWIAAWNSTETPAVELIDPVDGHVCELMAFGEYSTPRGVATEAGSREWIPARGSLTWSPNGAALAILVQPGVDDVVPTSLYVWSMRGLVGPIVWAETPRSMDGIAWSPDGSWIAATDTSHTVTPSSEASILIASADGDRDRIDLGCGESCRGDAPFISPDGRNVATLVSGVDEQPGGQLTPRIEIAVVDVSSGAVQRLANSSELLARRNLVGWAAPAELLLEEQDGRLVGVPLAAPTETVDYGFNDLPSQPTADYLGLSPDKTTRVKLQEGSDGQGEIIVSDSLEATRTIAVIDNPWGALWWSPDGLEIGYLIDVQTDDQGIWTTFPDGSAHRHLSSTPLVIDSSDHHVWQPVWPQP